MKKVVFLHIPKTAGQSVHAAMVNAFGRDTVCPARVNEQLFKLSIPQLNRYQVFSGHFDWSLLDCVRGPKHVFTILREPEERILSFYFYMREQAAMQPPGHRLAPGMKAVRELSAKEYFCGGSPHIRHFLDDHYDNFYTYYFAGRTYQGRSRLAGLVNRKELTRRDVMNMARQNMQRLNGVFTIDNMAGVFDMIREISRTDIKGEENYRVNVNVAIAAQKRRQALIDLGADDETFERIRQFCTMDNVLWKLYSERQGALAAN